MPAPDLAAYLDLHYRQFDYARSRPGDPCHFLDPFRNRDPRDIEIAGMVASSLAFGQVKVILSNVKQVMDILSPSPLKYIRAMDPARTVRQLEGFKHRWTGGKDIAYLLWSLRALLERHESIGGLVAESLDLATPDITPGLVRLAGSLVGAADPAPIYGRKVTKLPLGFRFLVPSPGDGSTCKRLLMFARWMVRRPEAEDHVDFGVWRDISPAALLLPLDTHTGRMVRYLGLVGMKRSLGYPMAREATAKLRELDPQDPVKYDFALAHLGISGACRHVRVPEVCGGCPLDPVCRL